MVHKIALVESAEGTILEVGFLKRWGSQHKVKHPTRVPFSLVNPKRGGPFLRVNPKSSKPLLRVPLPREWDPILAVLVFRGMRSRGSLFNRHALLGCLSVLLAYYVCGGGFAWVWHPFTRAAVHKVVHCYISLLIFI